MKGVATKGNTITYGSYGLVAQECGWITSNQIEAARIAINRHLDRKGQVWIRVFPAKPFTKKPLEVRMGKGKGNVEGWFAPVLPGRVLFEVKGCSETVAREAMARAANKLCLRCKFLTKGDL